MGGAWVLAMLVAVAPAAEPASAEPASAEPEDPAWWVVREAQRKPVYMRAEIDGTGVVGFLPTPIYGAQVAVVAGRPWIHGRFAVGAASAPTFALGGGRIGAIAEAADVRLCGAAHRRRHRFRLCGGGEVGVMHLRWVDYDAPGRREFPLAHAVLGGDYGIALTDFFDLHLGVDLRVPMIGVRLAVRHPGGTDTVRSASVATAFRVGIGFRLH